MDYRVNAACLCKTGRIRKVNEDNFYFDGRCLEQNNSGLRNAVEIDFPTSENRCISVFDGMGGESYGEIAAFSAAREMQRAERDHADFFIRESEYLTRLTMQVNNAVVDAARELHTSHMGSTMAALMFSSRNVYVCNIGDSRAYRLRGGEFMQLSRDHLDSHDSHRKAPLTQYLGIDPEEMILSPYIAKGDLKAGDRYLLCSDGLTDMLTNIEICDILMTSTDARDSVTNLVERALANGGRDNITAIVCIIHD